MDVFDSPLNLVITSLFCTNDTQHGVVCAMFMLKNILVPNNEHIKEFTCQESMTTKVN